MADAALAHSFQNESDVVYLSTLQFSWGSLFDSKPHDGEIHLVRGTHRGTPGPTLCGIDRFAEGGPGWSVGGGISGPGISMTPCAGCVEVAKRDFPGVPVAGMRVAADPIAAAIGVEGFGHSCDVPARRAEMNRLEAERRARVSA